MCQALRELFADELEERENIGIKKGIKQGVEQGINSIIINMHTKNCSLQQISSITDKSISDIKLILERSSVVI